MTDWRVRPARAALAGVMRVPGDKSIGHRAVLFGALSDGACRVTGLSGGEDNRRTVAALRALGVRIEDDAAGGGTVVHGVGLQGLSAPATELDCGNSGTSMRLLAGLLAGQPFEATLVGDDYLHRRPMRRVTIPLEQMGARVTGQPGRKPGELYPPLRIQGAARLGGLRYESPVASAQVKSAILIAGLYAHGVTEVHEPGPSRDHTERMLAWLGAPISKPAANTARLDPQGWDRRLRARALHVPGDPSSSAFLLAAALAVPGSVVTVEGVCVNPTRTGFLDVLRLMGARIDELNPREEAGEPLADLRVTAGSVLRGVSIAGDVVVRAIDEIPLLAVVAARAHGETVVREAAELRVKESDRVATTVALLRAFGVDADELPDGLVVRGVPDRRLGAAAVDTHGDHRIAMAAAVAGLAADGESTIRDVANVATSFPTFRELMTNLGAEIDAVN